MVTNLVTLDACFQFCRTLGKHSMWLGSAPNCAKQNGRTASIPFCRVRRAVLKNCPCAKWHAKAAKQNGRSASIPFCWPASLRLICQHRVQYLQNGMVAPQGVRFARLERVTCRTEFWSPECVRSKTGPIRLGTDVREVLHVCAYGDARAS